jgi:hypothetical protein
MTIASTIGATLPFGGSPLLMAGASSYLLWKTRDMTSYYAIKALEDISIRLSKIKMTPTQKQLATRFIKGLIVNINNDN